MTREEQMKIVETMSVTELLDELENISKHLAKVTFGSDEYKLDKQTIRVIKDEIINKVMGIA